MGAMALTWTIPEAAREQVKQVRKVLATTSAPFQVNFALAFPPNSLTAALEAGAPVVTFSWGDPAEYLPLVRSFGATVGIQVTNGEGARRAVDLGANFLICQGMEAGGHVQATRSLWRTLDEVLAVVGALPVIASGGIGDGQGIAQALQRGSSGAMLGTRFVVTVESRALAEYKQKLLAADADDTALTVCFDGGWPYAAHRVLRNNTLEMWEAAGCPPSGNRPGEGDVTGYNAAGDAILRYEDTAPREGFTGDVDAMCLYAGTSCAAIHDIPTAGNLVARLWAEARIHREQSGPQLDGTC